MCVYKMLEAIIDNQKTNVFNVLRKHTLIAPSIAQIMSANAQTYVQHDIKAIYSLISKKIDQKHHMTLK